MLTEAILLEQNKRLRGRVEELEETIRQMKDEARPEKVALPPGLPRLSRLEEKVYSAVWSRRGRLVPKATIYDELYGDDDDINPKIIDVCLYHIRRKLRGTDAPSIVTVWGKGYAIDLGQESTSCAAGEVSQLLG